MDFLTNPYVIIFIVVAVVVSNIMALKYTANAKFGMKQKPKTDDENKENEAQKKTAQANKEDDEDDKSSFW
ncbi:MULTISPECIES: DUF2897 family protein [Enterovibrio]|uniref:DUF2897 family protein n=1 Tax=Enterovibrio TaxID=188143 RepID=UPI0002E2FD6E|nr:MULTISPECIES: DUF2897 family protein [Enterovibrio]MBE1274642.1 DUF2897 family protein [Enterovibrio baiacu]OEE47128.1 hypothetical protein A1OS_08080 [Enterovibrio norvegicus]OEF62277.1 hypothetical protein A1OW_18875 [Enterovibrio norvegicus]PMH64595.1 hypothetical protein BCU62_15190 [Enterovibrio norvegicus]